MGGGTTRSRCGWRMRSPNGDHHAQGQEGRLAQAWSFLGVSPNGTGMPPLRFLLPTGIADSDAFNMIDPIQNGHDFINPLLVRIGAQGH